MDLVQVHRRTGDGRILTLAEVTEQRYYEAFCHICQLSCMDGVSPLDPLGANDKLREHLEQCHPELSEEI